MRGIVPAGWNRDVGSDFARRGGTSHIYLLAQFGGVAFRDQAFERNIDGIAVAEVLGAIRIGELHRLELQMKSGWRTGTDHARGVSLQNVQHLNQVNPAARGRRHRDNLAAPIGSIYLITNDPRVIFEITAGHQTTRPPGPPPPLYRPPARHERPRGPAHRP